MGPNQALLFALLSAGVSVAIVGTDLAFTLTVRLDEKEADGSWKTLQVQPYSDSYSGAKFFDAGCAGRFLRIVVDNDRPISATKHVLVFYMDAKGRQTELLDEDWTLAAFAERAHEFEIPQTAFESDSRDTFKPQVNVNVQVSDDLYLGHCVSMEA